MNMNQTTQTTPAPFIHTIDTTTRPDPVYNIDAEYNDIDDIIYILSDQIFRNLDKHRKEQIKKSNLYLFLYYYIQIKRTNKKRKIHNFIIKSIQIL